MFKKLNKALCNIDELLTLIVKYADKIDVILEFIRAMNTRFSEFDEFRRESVEFLKSDNERFEDADK